MNCSRVLMGVIISFFLILPVMAADTSDQMNSAGTLYSKSVDLANDGNYSEALAIADEALAMNVTSLVPLIQANRAGILVMLGRFEEADAAADVVINTEGNLTTVHSIAWYNKGNALRALGRIDEAKAAYENAYSLDNSLVPPDMSADSHPPTTPAKSSLLWFTPPVAITLVSFICSLLCHRKK